MRTAVRSALCGGILTLAAVVAAPGNANAALPQGVAEHSPAAHSPAPTHTTGPATRPASTSAPTPTPSPASSLPGVSVRTFSYGRHVRQRMDVWWHRTGQPRPAVFLIHGGWWWGGDKKYMNSISRSYAEQGYTVVNLNYRLSGDAAWPAQRTDAIDAIKTVRRHAALFNTDPDRYVVIGFSAGGHIATSLGVHGRTLPGLRGVVGLSPVVSPLSAYADGAGAFAGPQQRKLRKAALMLAGGCSPAKCPGTWTSMEVPFHATPDDVPMLTVHSEDEFVPPYQSELLKQALEEVGVPMTVETVPGAQHSNAVYREPGVTEAVQAWVAARLV